MNGIIPDGAAPFVDPYDHDYLHHFQVRPHQYRQAESITAERFELYRLNGIARRQTWVTLPQGCWTVLASVKVQAWRRLNAPPNGRLPSPKLHSGEEEVIQDRVVMDIEDPWTIQFDAENNNSYNYMKQTVTDPRDRTKEAHWFHQMYPGVWMMITNGDDWRDIAPAPGPVQEYDLVRWPGKDDYYVTEICKTSQRRFHTHEQPPKIRVWKCYSNFYAAEVMGNVLRGKWTLVPEPEDVDFEIEHPNARAWGAAKTSNLTYSGKEMAHLAETWQGRKWYGIHARTSPYDNCEAIALYSKPYGPPHTNEDYSSRDWVRHELWLEDLQRSPGPFIANPPFDSYNNDEYRFAFRNPDDLIEWALYRETYIEEETLFLCSRRLKNDEIRLFKVSKGDHDTTALEYGRYDYRIERAYVRRKIIQRRLGTIFRSPGQSENAW